VNTKRPDPALPRLLDERTRPDFREVYGALVARSEEVDVAIRKIRLSGVSLRPHELGAPARLRILLSEIDVLTLASEAESMAVRRRDRERLELITGLLASETLLVRSAPLGGWAPDFSVFQGSSLSPTAIIGPHWLQRPYSHRGPALACVVSGSEALWLAERFRAIWNDAHEVRVPLARTLDEALARVPEPGPSPAPIPGEAPLPPVPLPSVDRPGSCS
jgi:hypothetical protein